MSSAKTSAWNKDIPTCPELGFHKVPMNLPKEFYQQWERDISINLFEMSILPYLNQGRAR